MKCVQLGRPIRRDEVYIRTHTRKTRVPTEQAVPIINKLKSIDEAHPELTERSIQQGDVLAAACGEKEPRGRVRALGLGPTPQDIGTPYLKCYKSTRLQMEVLAREKVESDKTALEQRIQELEQQLQERRNLEIRSQNCSNSRSHVSPRSQEHVDEAQAHDGQAFEDEVFPDINDNSEQSDEEDYLLLRRPPAAPSTQHAGDVHKSH
ncbi:uncharacterized protein LOC110436589 isoform X2 [Sorghum bicolor]|uniref:uncharacterized protein LOC110436589 isoform X2 n=1 Tax=Sorghum bicolor TaxID=4558 RepID=UPI000B423828|nr:uncharacterized protein LOC110436589 isoform X2 [Sorghum bicolor]|eukprot:XP_021319632.1 uncharacterized protein LOC110436589 isoform X2 [Sorghum bicolor]